MARKQKLKVYRTPIGFHDAYVAAPSQKAALEAWNSDVDLFARGIAEAVTDDALTGEPLEKPGTIVKRARGAKDAFMADLPKDAPRRKRTADPQDSDDGPPPRRRNRSGQDDTRPAKRATSPRNASHDSAAKPVRKPKARPKPRPSRARLEAAEAALERAETDHKAAIAEIREREKALQEERRGRDRRHEADVATLEKKIDAERNRYTAALQKWRD